MSQVALCGLFVLIATSASASDAVDVAIAVAPQGDPFSTRLLAEVRAVGLRAVEVPSTGGSLEQLARTHNAAAATRALATGAGLEVWLGERASGRPMLRHLVVDERPEGPDVTMVVLQTAELLRSGMTTPPPAPPPAPPAAAPAVAAEAAPAAVTPAPPADAALSIGLGVGVAAQAGGFGAGAAGRADVGWWFLPAAALELWGQWPWQPSAIEAVDGRTQARAHRFGMGLRLGVSRRAWFADVGTGAAVEWWRIEGEGQAPLIGRGHDIARGAGYGRLRTGWIAAAWLHVGVEAFAAVAARPTKVTHAQRTVGEVGPVGGALFFMLEAFGP